MKIRYITLWINHEFYSGINDRFRVRFNANVRFINNYLSKAIRKENVEDFGFRMISINLSSKIETVQQKFLEVDKALSVVLPFNSVEQEKYLRISDEFARYDFYLQKIETAYIHICKTYRLPIETFINILYRFRVDGYSNKWLWKKKLLRDRDLYVFFNCSFTSFDFTLSIDAYNAKRTVLKISDVLLRTYPNELCFDKDFRHLVINADEFTITNFLDKPLLSVCIDDLQKGVVQVNNYGNDLLHKYDNEIKELI